MVTQLSPEDVTPERVITTAEKHGLRLIPGDYLTYDGMARPIGCCPLGALVVEAKPNLLQQRDECFNMVLDEIGLDGNYCGGVAGGFDGKAKSGQCRASKGYLEGYALGVACRKLAGLGAPGGQS